jgi:hypothetical protein
MLLYVRAQTTDQIKSNAGTGITDFRSIGDRKTGKKPILFEANLKVKSNTTGQATYSK